MTPADGSFGFDSISHFRVNVCPLYQRAGCEYSLRGRTRHPHCETTAVESRGVYLLVDEADVKLEGSEQCIATNGPRVVDLKVNVLFKQLGRRLADLNNQP